MKKCPLYSYLDSCPQTAPLNPCVICYQFIYVCMSEKYSQSIVEILNSAIRWHVYSSKFTFVSELKQYYNVCRNIICPNIVSTSINIHNIMISYYNYWPLEILMCYYIVMTIPYLLIYGFLVSHGKVALSTFIHDLARKSNSLIYSNTQYNDTVKINIVLISSGLISMTVSDL